MSYAKEKTEMWAKMQRTLDNETRDYLNQGFSQEDAAKLAFQALCVTYADWFFRKQEEVDRLTSRIEHSCKKYEEQIANQRKMIEQLQGMLNG